MMSDSESPGASPIDKPFEFMKLPYDLRFMVIKKMTLRSFIRLKKCSKSTLETCENCVFVPDFHVNKFNYNYPTPGLVFSDDFSEDLCALFRGREVSIHLVEIEGNITCSPQDFNAFLEETKVIELIVDDSNDIEVYNQPAVRELYHLFIKSEENPPLPTETVLALRAPFIDLPSLHFEVLRPMLDQWRKGLREIEEVIFTRPSEIFAVLEHEPHMLLILLLTSLFSGLEAEFRIVEMSVQNLFFVADVTRSDGKSLRIDVEVGLYGRVEVQFNKH